MNYLRRLTGTTRGMGKHCPIRKTVTLVMLGCVMGLAMVAVDAVMPKPDARNLLLESRANVAEERNHELLEVLAGRLQMIEPIEGEEHFAKVATVTWELVQRIEKEN